MPKPPGGYDREDRKGHRDSANARGPGGQGPRPDKAGTPPPGGDVEGREANYAKYGNPSPAGGPPGSPPPGAPQMGAMRGPEDRRMWTPDSDASDEAKKAFAMQQDIMNKNSKSYSDLSRPWDAGKYNMDEARRRRLRPRA